MKLAISYLVIFTWSVVTESTAHFLMNTIIQHSHKALNNAHSGRRPLSDAFQSFSRSGSSEVVGPSQNDQGIKTRETKSLTIENLFNRRQPEARRSQKYNVSQRLRRSVPHSVCAFLARSLGVFYLNDEQFDTPCIRTNNAGGLGNIFNYDQFNSILSANDEVNGPNHMSNAFGNEPNDCPSKWSKYDLASGDVPQVSRTDKIYPRYIIAPKLIAPDHACERNPSRSCAKIMKHMVILKKDGQDVVPMEIPIHVGFKCQEPSLTHK